MMKKIGKYEIIGEIGKGAMGVVYKAHDSLIGRDVAIKMISESILEVPEIKERFYREARSVGKLSKNSTTSSRFAGGCTMRTPKISFNDNTLSAAFGFRAAPSERFLILGNVLVALNDGGLRATVAPTFGMTVNF